MVLNSVTVWAPSNWRQRRESPPVWAPWDHKVLRECTLETALCPGVVLMWMVTKVNGLSADSDSKTHSTVGMCVKKQFLKCFPAVYLYLAHCHGRIDWKALVLIQTVSHLLFYLGSTNVIQSITLSVSVSVCVCVFLSLSLSLSIENSLCLIH